MVPRLVGLEVQAAEGNAVTQIEIVDAVDEEIDLIFSD